MMLCVKCAQLSVCELASLNVVDDNCVIAISFSSLQCVNCCSSSLLFSFSIRSCSSLLSRLFDTKLLFPSLLFNMKLFFPFFFRTQLFLSSLLFSKLPSSFVLFCFHLRSNSLPFNMEILLSPCMHLCDHSFLRFSSISCFFFSWTLIQMRVNEKKKQLIELIKQLIDYQYTI